MELGITIYFEQLDPELDLQLQLMCETRRETRAIPIYFFKLELEVLHNSKPLNTGYVLWWLLMCLSCLRKVWPWPVPLFSKQHILLAHAYKRAALVASCYSEGLADYCIMFY
jgi:hypothetical protein